MSTIRNYPFVKKNYNTFLGCYDEFKSKKYPITKELKWLLEEDMNKGAQILADTSKKMVELSLDYGLKDNSHLFSKKPKESFDIDNTPGGNIENYSFHHKEIKNKYFYPKSENVKKMNIKKQELIKNNNYISISMIPNKNHYINKCEFNKRKDSFCKGCALDYTTLAVKGTGRKSAKKTKGRQKRKLNQKEYLKNY